MITYESIKEKLGYDPLNVNISSVNDWMCDGEETLEEKKMRELSIEELDFLMDLFRKQKLERQTQVQMDVAFA